jgi:hypothetical protein
MEKGALREKAPTFGRGSSPRLTPAEFEVMDAAWKAGERTVIPGKLLTR